MKSRTTLIASLSMAVMLSTTVSAQNANTEESKELTERLTKLERELLTLRKQLDSAQVQEAKPPSDTNDSVSINWKGAPEIKGDGGWSIKPRGRVLYDMANLSGLPSSIDAPGEGFSNEARRARLGVQGTLPGGFAYKVEVDYAGGSELTDAYVSYKDGSFKLTVGQHNNFQGLEELSSSNDTSFIERAAFTDAFGFKRKMGVSAAYKFGEVMLQGGIFTDNIDDLSDGNNALSFDGRITYFTKLNGGQLHLGSSLHMRDLGDEIDSVRYRQRPLVHSVDTRFINTNNISGATDELSYGFEAAYILDRFHVAAETHSVEVSRTDAADPSFFGGSLEAGYFLTSDKREYKEGVFKGVKVSNPVGSGGMGAWQVNVRFDYLDLVDEGIVGGKQDAVMASLIWTPINYVRVMLNYGHLSYSDALNIVDGAPDDYSVNVIGLRTQVSF